MVAAALALAKIAARRERRRGTVRIVNAAIPRCFMASPWAMLQVAWLRCPIVGGVAVVQGFPSFTAMEDARFAFHIMGASRVQSPYHVPASFLAQVIA